MWQVIIAGKSHIVENPFELGAELGAAYARGEVPTITKIEDISEVEKPENGRIYQLFGSSPKFGNVRMPPEVSPVVQAAYLGAPKEPHMPESVKARIDRQHAAIQASGIDVAKAATKAAQVAPNGTAMWESGYAEQDKRKKDHDQKLPFAQMAEMADAEIKAENRLDVEMSAADFARGLSVNGSILVNGKKLTEQAIRGLANRLESPMLSYVLGLHDRMIDNSKRGNTAAMQADKAKIAEIIAHECRHNPDAKLKLRTRNGGIDDCFAVLSPSYSEYDAPRAIARLARAVPKDAKGSWVYDAKSTQWEVRAPLWTPTPVQEQAIGEAFEVYASFRGRDNGTSSLFGGGGFTLIRCYNATTYTAASELSRVHRGKMDADVERMIVLCKKAFDTAVTAWGVARETEIPLTAEERKAGDKFLAGLFTEMLSEKPLASVLPGRKADHASALTMHFHAERRNRETLVRADLAQAWTRYIQGQPSDVRRDAESAIGAWLVAA